MPDIDLMGATYPDVPAVTLPSGDGTATFYHPDEIDYAASPTSGGNATKANGILYAAVDSTSTSTKFTATVDGLTSLYDGACVMLHNGVVTSAKGFTINVNGLGAKKCYSSLTNATQETTIFNVAYTLMFVYSTALDSGNGGWWVYRGIDTNTTYTPVKLGFGYGHCTTAAATAAKVVAISGYTLNTGGIVSVLFDNDVQAGATLNVTSKGAKAIYHKGAAIADGIIKAGDTATFMYSTQYHLVSVDRDAYTLPPATASTLGGVKVGDGLSVEADGELSVTDYGNIVTQSNFGVVLDETSRFTVVAADATSAAIIGSAFGKEPAVRMPNALTSTYYIYIAINCRYCLSWMNGTRMELAPLNVEVDAQTQAITLYARGRSSMAYGVAGVDDSWTITALPTDVDGVSY